MPLNGHTAGVSVRGSNEKCAEKRERRRRVGDRRRFCAVSHPRARWKIDQTNETNWSGKGRPIAGGRRRDDRLPSGPVRNDTARRWRAAPVGIRGLPQVRLRAAARGGGGYRRLKKRRTDGAHEGEPTEHA